MKYPVDKNNAARHQGTIVTSPSMIFGDEPTGALDSKSATDLLESMKTLNEKDLVTILMVTHDAFAASYCKRVVFIKDGKLYKELHRKRDDTKTVLPANY